MRWNSLATSCCTWHGTFRQTSLAGVDMFVLLHESEQFTHCFKREFGTNHVFSQARQTRTAQRQPQGDLRTVPHHHVNGPTTAARYRQNLETALVKWVGWVGYLHVVTVGTGPVSLAFKWGIEN